MGVWPLVGEEEDRATKGSFCCRVSVEMKKPEEVLVGGEEEGWTADGGLFAGGDEQVRRASCWRVSLLKYFVFLFVRKTSIFCFIHYRREHTAELASC